MRYLPLFDLTVRHQFYSDGRCRDFELLPTAATETLVKNHRSILKLLPDGLRLLVAVDDGGTPFLPISEGATFGFRLRLRNNELPLFTDLAELDARAAPLFTNAGLGATAEPKLRLSQRESVSTEDLAVARPGAEESFVIGGRPRQELGLSDFSLEPADGAVRLLAYDEDARRVTVDSRSAQPGQSFAISYPSRPKVDRGVFAEVEIHANETLPNIDAPSEAPRRFEVAFEAKRAHWCYYCVTDLKTASGDFRIVDASESGADATLRFSDENRTDLNETPDSSDDVAVELAQRYPGLRQLRFRSDSSISCRQAARKNLEFRLNGNRIPGSLPNPSIRNYTTLRTLDGGVPQERSALFQVVKFLAHSQP